VEKDSYITPINTLDIIAYVDPLSQILAIFIIPFFKRKELLVVSYFIVGLLNILIGVMAGINSD